MGNIRMGPPLDVIGILQEQTGAKNFVETGTFSGRTAFWASTVFDQVITIEASPTIYEDTKRRYSDVENIDFRLGDSQTELAKIVSTLTAPSVFWLDAHWSGSNTFGIDDECPLLDELDTINALPNDHIILIDDARYFTSPPPYPHKVDAWPDLLSVCHSLTSTTSRHIVIFQDVFICVPIALKSLLAETCQDITTEEYQNRAKPNALKRARIFSHSLKAKFASKF